MTPAEALSVLDQAAGMALMSRADHRMAAAAVEVVKAALDAVPQGADSPGDLEAVSSGNGLAD